MQKTNIKHDENRKKNSNIKIIIKYTIKRLSSNPQREFRKVGLLLNESSLNLPKIKLKEIYT